MGRPFPVSASSSVELALVGPPRPITGRRRHVAGRVPVGRTDPRGGFDPTIVCLAVTDAVRVPCALVIESKALPPLPAAGTVGVVGGGCLIDGTAFR